MKLYDTGVYLLNGQKIVPENQADFPVSKEEAAKSTIAYSILRAHNTSGNMEKLQIKFDKLTSHDITFVGIIQTARASGLEKFPVPYVLTNCHNSLCAVGGTINDQEIFQSHFCNVVKNNRRIIPGEEYLLSRNKSTHIFNFRHRSINSSCIAPLH